MSAIGEALVHGLRTVAGRPQLLLIELAVKAAWVFLAGAGLLLALAGAAARLAIDPALAGALEGAPLSPAALGLALAPAFAGLLRALLAGGLLALLIWIPLEAFLRGGVAPWGGDTFLGDARRYFPRFLLTGILRRGLLLVGAAPIAAVALGPLLTAPLGEWGQVWPEIRAGALGSALAVLLLALALSVGETLVRHLPSGAAAHRPEAAVIVLATLGAEWAILVTAAVFGLALTAAADSLAVGVLVLGVLAGFRTGLHSGCLLVRGAAVARIGAGRPEKYLQSSETISMESTSEEILILDFGSQYTQLIGRRIREAHVYSEILPFYTPAEDLRRRNPRGLILSGGPSSVYDPDAPHCDPAVFEMGIPILGVCYGMQLIAKRLGGVVQPATEREYGHGRIRRTADSLILDGIERVWMSHGDHILEPPPGFTVTAATETTTAAIENAGRRIFGVQFHPEVVHTDHGAELLRRFVFDVCRCTGTWSLGSFLEEEVERIRRQVGSGRVISAISGGVDSTVASTLVARAVGDQLTCIFVDTGVLRKDEFTKVLATLRDNLRLDVRGVDASHRFLALLAGVTDPETKRKLIGAEFIRVFEDEAAKIGAVDFLVQGTLYPDVIESVSVRGPSQTIKSHHNVGGLPEKMRLRLVEPLRELFKDEVRQLGLELGLPEDLVWRQPFPGPGLAIRIMGEVTPDRIRIVQEADDILVGEIKAAGLYRQVWQSFAVLLPVRSVGVMGDARTYDYTVAVRAVTSTDGMTADWVRLPYDVLGRISNRIVNEVRGVNRVVYDVTSKPPSTIEWE